MVFINKNFQNNLLQFSKSLQGIQSANNNILQQEVSVTLKNLSTNKMQQTEKPKINQNEADLLQANFVAFCVQTKKTKSVSFSKNAQNWNFIKDDDFLDFSKFTDFDS